MSTELLLSIISLLISILGLGLHFVRFNKERPKLQINGIKCRHKPSSANVKKTGLRLVFTVHNKGDRATQLNSLELQGFGKIQPLEKAVEANKSVKEDCYFNLSSRIMDEELQCTFVLHHTHGEKRFEVTSKKTVKTLSGGVAVLDW